MAGLSLGAVLFCYWSVVSGPLFAVAVGSLVVAGERASAGGLDGRFRVRTVPAVVAVELGVALLAALRANLGLGFVAGGLFLLAAWLTGRAIPGGTPRRREREATRGRRPGD